MSTLVGGPGMERAASSGGPPPWDDEPSPPSDDGEASPLAHLIDDLRREQHRRMAEAARANAGAASADVEAH